MDSQSQSISIPNSLLLSFYPLYSTIQSINCQFKRHGNSILSIYPLHFQNWRRRSRKEKQRRLSLSLATSWRKWRQPLSRMFAAYLILWMCLCTSFRYRGYIYMNMYILQMQPYYLRVECIFAAVPVHILLLARYIQYVQEVLSNFHSMLSI